MTILDDDGILPVYPLPPTYTIYPPGWELLEEAEQRFLNEVYPDRVTGLPAHIQAYMSNLRRAQEEIARERMIEPPAVL